MTPDPSPFNIATKEDLEQLKNQFPHFKGNFTHLHMFMQVVDSSRATKERVDLLRAWSSFNTNRSDSAYDPVFGSVKTSFEISYLGLNLKGLHINTRIIGNVDLGGADLRGAHFVNTALTKANFAKADLTGATFEQCWLRGANFTGTRINGTNFTNSLMADTTFRRAKGNEYTIFSGADLQGSDLSFATLPGAKLIGANLQLAQLIETDLRGADISRSKVFGIAAWSPVMDNMTKQDELLVTPTEPDITVNRGERQHILEISDSIPPLYSQSLEHAHLIHLMSNPDLSDLLESVTSKGVLLLGRFAKEHGVVLDGLRTALRNLGYLPLKFDFRRPEDRTLKETVLTLAGLCHFVIADLTEASSIPLELTTIVKDFKIPIVPIQRMGRHTFSMFVSLEQEYRDRILPPLEYESLDDLIQVLEPAIITPALDRAARLKQAKSFTTDIRSTKDYLKK